MQFIVRQKYLDELIELYGTPDIKVITGIRRSGKSVLLQEFITYLQSLEEKSNIVMINLQELEFDHLLEYHALHKYILGQYKEGMNNVLLIDEVQMCPQFELAINSIYTKGIYDIYVTGSNAFLLSSDLATLFTGRTMEIKVYPFSFVELRMDLMMHLISMSEPVVCREPMYIRQRIDSMIISEMCMGLFL